MALTGCFGEDYSFCPDENNVSIAYRLPDKNGVCTFMQDVATVTTAVYDELGALVATAVTTDADHALFQGVKMKLDEGTYRLISWANSGSNTLLNNVEECYANPAQAHISYRSINAGRTGNGDPVYYGPNTVQTRTGNAQGEFVITIGSDGYEGTIDFRHAHRVIEIYVKGFDENGSTTPDVELTGLPDGLTFLGMGELTAGSPVASEIPSEPVTVEGAGYALARFKVFYFKASDYDIGIGVLNPVTGTSVYGTRLNDHIDAEDDNPSIEMTIRIVIEFKNGEITVSVPGWDSNDVDWGIFD